jgi:hypothetical protein
MPRQTCGLGVDELSNICAQHLLRISGHGRGTRYHIYGTNVALPDSNVTLNMDTSKANVALPGPNVTLNMDIQWLMLHLNVTFNG